MLSRAQTLAYTYCLLNLRDLFAVKICATILPPIIKGSSTSIINANFHDEFPAANATVMQPIRMEGKLIPKEKKSPNEFLTIWAWWDMI